ncbi:hypothetical protein [Rhizobium hidalgonense]|uniref:hypothetical protein n=1 Tax=Rhizobium hidalgonense TaxID=1538159 RepID=UPI00287123C6|nr:hypothetical protein [Rhizobium hidalgonense]MDR9813057.1 hypothetical protein [Rhizobium hidalgonense]
MTDITTRLQSMSEAMWMDRSQEEVDALLLEAKTRIEALEAALKPFATIAQVENSIGTRVGESVIVNVERCRDALAALIPQQKGNADG